ncbi:TIGR04282 family arsenosugar biosynthesis glycosyltransferase [Blastopirellula sp. J2-11]|uniref:TIGR04282 family arsenosugar biosynthesis glycosyltransferase n=1 Tax=Blastopirellula sp. J2-11 TaxID=2943192 RepID=UPI0021C83FAA|nr:TIGR04282 family arsenosugar biosynthesis glycosyltransferase [Blastopirellula sp. J2-11]UUO08510.1 TIGR04282 family arsenosugar biosynthesis glycosyltransferase [Blastopirellula sp. J2-11]
MEVLGMFAKHWRAGEVKTRLGAAIGLPAAAAVHHQFVRSAVKRFQSLGDRRVLAYAPADAEQSFATVVGDAWQLQSQSSGSLGDRISHFFTTAMAGGATKALLIGSDSPNLPTAYLQQAFSQLERCDVVLGPAEDGGYCAIGMNSPCEQLFTDISWSTSDVLTQTLARCHALGLRPLQTPTWYDVDTWDDLQRLQADLSHDDADLDLRQLRTELSKILADCPPL